MNPTKSWRPLPLPSSPDMPVLLVSMDIDTAAYTIHVTDMANMWSESLDRKAICIRGWGESTSIDPSDTPDNMAKFLTSLKSALDSSHPGHDETQLRLTRASLSDSGDDGLTLHITCRLPGLQPLKWPIHLKRSPSSAIATDLVFPLIQAHLARHQEVESLIRTLGQKDVVLNKLLDKLDAMGTGLEHVFNALSGKKKISRAAAADKIPGLAPFNRSRWQSDVVNSRGGPNNTETLVNEVFGGKGLEFQSTQPIDGAPGLDQWWHEFRGASSSQRPSQTRDSVSREKVTPHPDESMDVDEDDDFQVQSTPPHLASRRPAVLPKEPPSDDGSTEDGNEPPRPARNSRVVPTETRKFENKKRGPRLGTLGRKEQSPPARSVSPIRSPPRTRVVDQKVDDSETASDPDDDAGETASEAEEDPQPQPTSRPSPPPPKPVTRAGGLGRIGGPKIQQPVQKPSEPLSSEPNETATKPKKLGTIGKLGGEETATTAPSTSESRGRTRTPVVKDDDLSSPKARETSKERADRRREELKRELEKKALAGPAKKKRKF
ncbi:XRCC4-like factor-domain-containing protein [Mariannaea sp. PMI_226]|nr:XRCC4-like factor-domain-containing protein [Mariannaea sp. PMI_226]